MAHMGMKIKELRKKKDMTQEKLADYLNVSFQAVSKWETGAASPDLSMIVPLARLLEVSTDELFGIVDRIEDPREKELRCLYDETWKTGDIEKRYEIAQIAAAEYPGNLEYRKWLADSEWYYAYLKNSDEQRLHFEKSVRYYEMVIEDCADTEIKNSAIHGIVFALSDLNRRDEALQYAKQHPDSDNLLKLCLKGEEWEKHHQNLIFKKLDALVGELESDKYCLEALQAAEKIIKIVIDDENYLWFHDILMHNYIWQAQCLTREKRYDEAISILKKSYDHAVKFTEINEHGKTSPVPYTCSILNRLYYDSNTIIWSGMSAMTEDFKEYLTWKEFDSLREHNGFKELFSL